MSEPLLDAHFQELLDRLHVEQEHALQKYLKVTYPLIITFAIAAIPIAFEGWVYKTADFAWMLVS